MSVGPIKPNPGPILPIDDAEADKDVTISILNEENIIAPIINISI